MIRIASSRKVPQVMALGLLLTLLQPPVVSQAKTVDQVEDSSDLGVAGSLVAGQGAEVELGSNTQSEDSNGLVANGCEDFDAGAGKTDEFSQEDDNEVVGVMTGGYGVEKEGDDSSQVIDVSPSLRTEAHVQDIGWLPAVGSGGVAGTTGKNLNLEGLRVFLDGVTGSDLQIRAHVSSIGWQDCVSEGAVAGTVGKNLPIEALQIKLTGEASAAFDVWYRVHSADFGWGGWASNGASAGSQGFAKAAQAIEVRLVPKGQGAPGDTANAFRAPTAIWSSCSSNIGWRTSKSSSPTPSFTLGTTGRRLALEAFSISLSGLGPGSVNYAAHVSNIGWQEAVADGATAGTTGRGLPVEAIRINLSGDLCDSYDIWYRAHISNIGWLGWTKNGASAGSSGLSSPVEAVEVLVQRKGASAPGDGTAFLEKPSIAYSAYSAGAGWGSTVSNSGVAGVTGRGCALEAFKMNYSGSVPGGLSYRAHLANLGWQDTVDGDAIAGAPGQGNDLQAIAISLTGEAAKYYDVWYRVHVEDYGWLGWAKNGAYAGTSKLGLQAEAIQVTITSRNASAPGSTQDAYFEVPPAAPFSFLGISRSRLVSWLQSHSSDYYYLGTRYSTSLSVSGCMCPKGSPRSDGYTGMNCGGFVAHAYRALGLILLRCPLPTVILHGLTLGAVNM